MSKLYEFLKEATEEQLKEWTDNAEEYEFDSPPTNEDAFNAVVDWVIEDLKNMWYNDVETAEWNRLENIKDAAKDAQNELK